VVIDFGVKHQDVALWKSLSEASVQKARNGPSTQLIEAKSNKLRRNIKCHDESGKTQLSFELSNANNGQKL
jgi:hypothetical protein